MVFCFLIDGCPCRHHPRELPAAADLAYGPPKIHKGSARMSFRVVRLAGSLVCGFTLLACLPPVSAQSEQPSIFVANNGNCEGSVTSFLVNDDGTLQFVEKVVTGSVPCGSGQ